MLNIQKEVENRSLLSPSCTKLTCLPLWMAPSNISVHTIHSPKTKYLIFRRKVDPSRLKAKRSKAFQSEWCTDRLQISWKRSCLLVLLNRPHPGRRWLSIYQCGYFDVSVEDFEVVELFESFEHLNEDVPDELFFEGLGRLLLFGYSSREIAVVCKFHHNAVWISIPLPNRLARLVHESFLVSDYIRVLDRSQNANLVQSVFFLFDRKSAHFHSLQSIETPIF